MSARPSWKTWAAASLLLSTAACARLSLDGTSVFVHASLDDATAGATQLGITGYHDRLPVFGPEILPEAPAGPLSAHETVRILLSDSLGGERIRLELAALREGRRVLEGEAWVEVVKDREVDVSVTLRPVDAEASGACGAVSCADGCCEGELCRPRSLDQCGANGTTCFACDPRAADGCSAAGGCRCGGGAACAPGLLCEGGSCRCGEGGPACGPGQRCQSGSCVCDALSCSGGCCTARDNGACRAEQLLACGAGGAICAACSSTLANGCDDGACRCGAGPPCDPDRADRCDPDGRCRCGTRSACGGGKQCVSGRCTGDDDD